MPERWDDSRAGKGLALKVLKLASPPVVTGFASKADWVHFSVTPGFRPVIEEDASARTVLTVAASRKPCRI